MVVRRFLPRTEATALFISMMLVSPEGLRGQRCYDLADLSKECHPRGEGNREWSAHALDLGLNVLLGGVTAGVGSKMSGGSFWEGFKKGWPGGTVHYAGKVLGSRDFRGAPLLGRQVASAGSSMISNASSGRALLDSWVVPWGPLRMYVYPREEDRIRLKLDLVTSLAAVYALGQGAEFDRDASIASGTLVFEMPDGFNGWEARGASVGAVIMYKRDEIVDWVLSHESVHVAQHDLAMTAWSEPLERWLMSQNQDSFLAGVNRHIDLGLYQTVKFPLQELLPYADRPWEMEAFLLDVEAR